MSTLRLLERQGQRERERERERDQGGQCLSIGVLSKYFTAMKVLSGLAYGQLEILSSVT